MVARKSVKAKSARFDVKVLPAQRIIADERLQARVGMNEAALEEYAEAYRNGESLPPIVVFDDGVSIYCADGFHRLASAIRAGRTEITCEVWVGGYADALLYAAGANATHGLRRSQEDKRKAVRLLLSHPSAGDWSDREIARRCHVSQPFVGKVRRGESDNVITSERLTDPERAELARCEGVIRRGLSELRPALDAMDRIEEQELYRECGGFEEWWLDLVEGWRPAAARVAG